MFSLLSVDYPRHKKFESQPRLPSGNVVKMGAHLGEGMIISLVLLGGEHNAYQISWLCFQCLLSMCGGHGTHLAPELV